MILTTNLTTKYYILIKIQIAHQTSLSKSKQRLKNEIPPYRPTKPYLKETRNSYFCVTPQNQALYKPASLFFK